MSGSKGGGGNPIGMIGGSLFEGFSNIKQMDAQKNYLADLESSFQQDAQYQKRVGDRKLSLLKRDQDQFYSHMQSQLAQSGISFEGSAVDLLVDTKVVQSQEASAVELDTNIRVNESYRKASQAHSQREDIESNYTWSATAGFLGGAAKGYAQWGGS